MVTSSHYNYNENEQIRKNKTKQDKTKQDKTKQTNKQTNSDACEKHPNRD